MNPSPSYVVPSVAVQIPDHVLVEAALPNGYEISPISCQPPDGHVWWPSKNGLVAFLIYEESNCEDVGWAEIVDGTVRFHPNDGWFGQKFLEAIYQKYPKYNPDRVVWVVFYKLNNQWLTTRRSVDSEVEVTQLLETMSDIERENAPTLCLMRAGDLYSGIPFWTLTTKLIYPRGKTNEAGYHLSVDVGQMEICLMSSEVSASTEE